MLHVLQIGTKQHQWLTPAARRSPRHVRNKDRFRRHTATEGLLARPSSSVAANLDRSHSDNAFDSRPRGAHERDEVDADDFDIKSATTDGGRVSRPHLPKALLNSHCRT